MSAPEELPADVDELIGLLRDATPSDAVTSQAREATLKAASTPTVPASVLGALAVVAVGALLVPWLSDVLDPIPRLVPTWDTTSVQPVPLPVPLPDPPEPTPTSPTASPLSPSHPVAPPRAPTPPTADPVPPPSRPFAALRGSPPPPDAHATGSASPARTTAAISPAALALDLTPIPDADLSPSQVYADAMRDLAAERWEDAAVGLQQVKDGATDDTLERVGEAEFFLAKCLFQLGLHHAAAAAFDEVTRRGADHPYFDESLPFLVQLAARLPEPRELAPALSRYSAAAIARFDHEPAGPRVRFVLGRARYEERRWSEAIGQLRRVPGHAPDGAHARLFEGIAYVRLRRSRPAVGAFRRAVRALEAGHGEPAERARLRDLAWMSLARVCYTQAMRRPEGRAELLSAALAAWRRVPRSSPRWARAFSEETWALYVAGDYERALGHVHALEAPSLRRRADPEALVIRAMIQLEHCQWDAAARAVEVFHQRTDLALAAAARAARMASTHEDAWRMLEAAAAGRSRVPAAILPRLRDAWAAPAIARQVRQVRSIDAETERLGALSAPFLEAEIAAQVQSELAVSRALAADRAGELARAEIDRLLDTLRERAHRMDTVDVELTSARRDELEHPTGRAMGPAEGGPIRAVQGGQIWPWEGEYWTDELPFYRQSVADRCR